jgi:hypothetical protein
MTTSPERAPGETRTAAWRFVESAKDVDPAFAGTTVVLDPGWTPGPETEPNVISALPAYSRVLEKHDLFRESLDLIDGWAERAGVVDQMLVEGVSYWFRLRESMWHWVHERLLWRYTFEELGISDRPAPVSIPWSETALIDVATALGGPVDVVRPPEPRIAVPSLRRRIVRLVPSAIRLAYRRRRPHPDTIRAERELELEREKEQAQESLLTDRVERLAGADEDLVLAVSTLSSHQQVGLPTYGRSVDPNLESILPALRSENLETFSVAWGMTRDAEELWPLIERNDRILPGWFVQTHWLRPEDTPRITAAQASVRDHLGGLTTPLGLAGLNVVEPFVHSLASQAELVVGGDVRDLACIERLLTDLSPRAILLTHEGHRTPWLITAARRGTPSFAVQHGVLYTRHPGYPDARDPRRILPTCTFVYGDFEQRVLRATGYLKREVAVSGSPRLDLDATSPDLHSVVDERAALRRHLGVADGDRLLVVSTVWYPFMRRTHLAHMLATLLAGPLLSIHVVFKQHPGERDEGPYRSLLTGLASVGGYEPPPMSVIKEIDLYALLRAADAHLGHQSTVLTDTVVAGTSNLVADIQASPPSLDYVGAGVAWPVRNVADVREAMRDLPRPSDEARRKFLDDHFRAGHAGRRIATSIAEAAAPKRGNTNDV